MASFGAIPGSISAAGGNDLVELALMTRAMAV